MIEKAEVAYLISAILVPGSNPDKVMQLARSKFIQVISSQEILEELGTYAKEKDKIPGKTGKRYHDLDKEFSKSNIASAYGLESLRKRG